MVQEKTPHSPRSHVILRCDPTQGAHKRENTTKNTTARGTQKRKQAVVCPVMQGAPTAQYGHDQVMPCPAHHTLLLKSPATILPVRRASHLLSILCIWVTSAPPFSPLSLGTLMLARAEPPTPPLQCRVQCCCWCRCFVFYVIHRNVESKSASTIDSGALRVCIWVCVGGVCVFCVCLCACVCVFGCVVVLFALGVWVAMFFNFTICVYMGY